MATMIVGSFFVKGIYMRGASAILPLTFDISNPRASQAHSMSVLTPAPPALLTREELKRQEGNLRPPLNKTNGKVSGPDGAAELLG